MDILQIIRVGAKKGNKLYFGIQFKQSIVKVQSRTKASEIVRHILNNEDMELIRDKRNFILLANGNNLGRITQKDYYTLTQKIIKEHHGIKQPSNQLLTTRNQNCDRETGRSRTVSVEIVPDSYQHQTPVRNTSLPNAGWELCLHQKTASNYGAVSEAGSRNRFLEIEAASFEFLIGAFTELNNQQRVCIELVQGFAESVGEFTQSVGEYNKSIDASNRQQQGFAQSVGEYTETVGEYTETVGGFTETVDEYTETVDELTEEVEDLIEFFKIGKRTVAGLPETVR
jgi:uncharacterized protein YozE (UPF0346 family)